MCGILLAIGDAFRADFDAALATLKSRGPDASEVLVHGDALLGHARLAVIDIDGGRQPMTAANGRLAMVYNGEIYNFEGLRRELEAAGHAFATRSDSEVLLTGYLRWGEAVVEKLDGMFAFAIHDLGDGSVFLARDRLGIKPLFWGEHGGGMVKTWSRRRHWRRSSLCTPFRRSLTPKDCATTSPSRHRWRHVRWCATSMPCRRAAACAGRQAAARRCANGGRSPMRRNARPIMKRSSSRPIVCWRKPSRTNSSPMCHWAPSSPAVSTAASSCITWRRRERNH
jgi:asparagine synthetase B (glutamine-hydrolysing)